MKIISCEMEVTSQAKEINSYDINNMIINMINIFELIFILRTGLFFAPGRPVFVLGGGGRIFFVMNGKKVAIGPAGEWDLPTIYRCEYPIYA
jgi:hypothetical protein